MTTIQKIIQPKVGLLKLAEKLGNVSEACKVMGYSRDSFYRFQKLYDNIYGHLHACAFAKVYYRKNELVAADMLNDKVLPFYQEQNIDLLRGLTDRKTEYCGARELGHPLAWSQNATMFCCTHCGERSNPCSRRCLWIHRDFPCLAYAIDKISFLLVPKGVI